MTLTQNARNNHSFWIYYIALSFQPPTLLNSQRRDQFHMPGNKRPTISQSVNMKAHSIIIFMLTIESENSPSIAFRVGCTHNTQIEYWFASFFEYFSGDCMHATTVRWSVPERNLIHHTVCSVFGIHLRAHSCMRMGRRYAEYGLEHHKVR